MATTVQVPDWIYPGAEVAEFAHGRTTNDGQVKLTEVTRVGKRDIVLANGARYNIRWMSRSTGTWSPTWYLRRRDDQGTTAAAACP